MLGFGMRRFIAALSGFLIIHSASGDILNLANGDRYRGSIELVNEKEVHLKSEVVGLLKVPRAKVASIYFGTNQPPVHVGIEKSAAKESLDAKSIEQVQKDFLATATPEANEMFTELVQGLASGKLSVADIRKQASDSLKELRELQAELGEEADNPLLDGYVGILEKFIREGGTNQPPAKVKKSAPPPADDP